MLCPRDYSKVRFSTGALAAIAENSAGVQLPQVLVEMDLPFDMYSCLRLFIYID